MSVEFGMTAGTSVPPRSRRSTTVDEDGGRAGRSDRPTSAPRSRRRTSSRCSTSSTDELIALAPVKTRIREIAALLLIDRLRSEVGLASERPSLHMSFTGNPGTGKTTVAMKMAQVLHRLGYIAEPRVVACTRDDLVGQYVGHTAPKTKEVLRRAYGGVLFIDEAYYLYQPENERDYGGEAIEILLQVMEAERDKLVVIFAGYKDRMDDFFQPRTRASARASPTTSTSPTTTSTS